MRKFISLAKYLIGWPLSLVALFFVGKLLIGKGSALTQIHNTNFWLLGLSLGIFIVFFFLRVLFWQKLLAYKNMPYSFKQTALTWGFSELKRYIPGTIWPILGRSSAYEKMGNERKAILVGILQEAEFLGISCLLVSSFAINFVYYGIFKQHVQFIPPLIATTVIIISILFLFNKKLPLHNNKFLKHFAPNLPIKETAYLLFLMSSAFLLFGVANYFAVIAMIPLYLPHILPISAFFVLSFLLGYLSFLAPMGLGVREGVVTIGLSQYVGLTNGALGAIFSRVMQIIGELFFLVLCAVWSNLGKKLSKIERFVLFYKWDIATVFVSICYTVYFTLASFLRYANFFTGRFDLGNMDQTVWNTIHGRLFQLTDPNGTAIVSRLSFHADFALVLLAPLYLIWQDPRTLLFIQSLALGVGGIFVFLIAKDILKKKSLAFAFALSYLLYPAINYANLFDFHSVTLAVPLFLAGWYFLIRKHSFFSIIAFLLAATVKEQIWFITGLIGLYMILLRRQYIYGILLSVISFGLFYYLFWIAIPAAHGGTHFALSYYSDFGTSTGGVIKTIFLNPVKTFMTIFGKWQLLYLLQLFAPLGFLSFFGLPVLIFASPDLLISLLSQNRQLHTIYYHYGAIPTPFLFIAAIYGFSFLQKHFSNFIAKYGFLLIIVPAIACAYAFGPLPGAYHMSDAMFEDQLPYAQLVDNFLQSIPKKYSVAATNNIGSHLSHRQKIYTIPIGLKDADIVVFLLDDDFAQPSLSEQKKMAQVLDHDDNYVKLYQYQDFVVYKKKNVPTYYKKQNHNILPLFKGN